MNQESIQRVESTSDTLKIVEARTDPNHRELLLLADKAIDVDGHCIGFLPHGAYHDATAHNRLFSLFRNDDRVGFVLWSRNQIRECRILQIWVRSDARLIEHGRALVEHLEEAHARRMHLWQLRAWVAEDLAANVFWPQIGFTKRGWRWGPAKRARRHNLWTRNVTLDDFPTRAGLALRSPNACAQEIA
jgi:GNAT superfamily N-acetyltransferase